MILGQCGQKELSGKVFILLRTLLTLTVLGGGGGCENTVVRLTLFRGSQPTDVLPSVTLSAKLTIE